MRSWELICNKSHFRVKIERKVKRRLRRTILSYALLGDALRRRSKNIWLLLRTRYLQAQHLKMRATFRNETAGFRMQKVEPHGTTHSLKTHKKRQYLPGHNSYYPNNRCQKIKVESRLKWKNPRSYQVITRGFVQGNMIMNSTQDEIKHAYAGGKLVELLKMLYALSALESTSRNFATNRLKLHLVKISVHYGNMIPLFVSQD
ncbi:hypothetical protein KIN20_020393 [Parelaphostrongylus tenuis]|uniref:Uncharacterized protein n=1 Tax=Parelaphostrongylus tenuis TaxID=148309 RepID=A0AAD5QTF1_PARTN|nr:hypothetical protein KIN20_020393 [Parelaphostrongylus tenuis]